MRTKKEELGMTRRWIAVLLGVFLVAGAVLQGADKKTPDGTVKLSEGSVAAGIGWSWGHGTLNYTGKSYRLRAAGASGKDGTGESKPAKAPSGSEDQDGESKPAKAPPGSEEG